MQFYMFIVELILSGRLYEIPIFSRNEEVSLESDCSLFLPQGFYSFLWHDLISQIPAPVGCEKSVHVSMPGLGVDFLLLSGDMFLYLQFHSESRFPEPHNGLYIFLICLFSCGNSVGVWTLWICSNVTTPISSF